MARAPSLWWPSIGQCALQLARTLYHTLHMLLFLVPFRRGGKKRRKYPAGVKKKLLKMIRGAPKGRQQGPRQSNFVHVPLTALLERPKERRRKKLYNDGQCTLVVTGVTNPLLVLPSTEIRMTFLWRLVHFRLSHFGAGSINLRRPEAALSGRSQMKVATRETLEPTTNWSNSINEILQGTKQTVATASTQWLRSVISPR